MESFEKFEDKYQAYLTEKKEAARGCSMMLILWAVLLVPAIGLCVFLWEWAGNSSNGFVMLLASMPAMLLTAAIVFWPGSHWRAYRSTVTRKAYELSLDMMESALREKYGDYTRDQVQYRILQHHCGFDARVKRNDRLAWLEGDAPFMIHRAYIDNDHTGEDQQTYFDGTAISVAAEDILWRSVDSRKLEKKLEKVWGSTIRGQTGYKVIFGLDEMEGRLWLTVGFWGLTLGEKHVSDKDLRQWYWECQRDVEFIGRTLDLVRSITPDYRI